MVIGRDEVAAKETVAIGDERMKKLWQSDKSVGEEIALWLLREVKKDGVFASLIVPAAVSFLTATATLVIFARP